MVAAGATTLKSTVISAAPPPVAKKLAISNEKPLAMLPLLTIV
jgi:hypothetical protein